MVVMIIPEIGVPHLPQDADTETKNRKKENTVAKFGRKTLLALAVAAATSHAYATSIDVSGDTRLNIEQGLFEEIILEGTAERAEDGIDFDAPQVMKGFTSNANFNLTGDFADAIGIDDDSGTPFIRGSITNNGNINVRGYNASGIRIANTFIGVNEDTDDTIGNIVNNGRIVINSSTDRAPEEIVAGILLEQTTQSGDLINTGYIGVNGSQAHGIKVDGTSHGEGGALKLSLIQRDVINSGDIEVEGADSRGLELVNVIMGMDTTKVGTDIENSGFITATGANAVALRLDQTNFNRIYNTGGIGAEGANSVGIEIRESLSNSNVGGGIINEGYIAGEETGIRITNDLMNSAPGGTSHESNVYRIVQNAGFIASLDTAIDGNFQTNLYLNGGMIYGDLEGIRQAFVNGDVEMDSEIIEVAGFDVQTGELLLTHTASNFTGNVSVANNAGITAYISDATDASKALVKVDGTMTLADGSRVSVTTGEGEFSKNANYILISADELINLGATVGSATPLLKVSNVKSNDTQMSADVALATGDEAWDGLSEIGVTQNGLNAAHSFIDGVLNKIPTDSALFQSFVNADSASLRRLSEQLHPEINGGTQAASMAATDLTSSALNSRAQSLGANSGEGLVETGAWVKILDGNSDQGTRNQVAGYDADSQGLIIGVDGMIDSQTTVGLAFSHVITDVQSDNGNKTDVTSNALSAYGSWENGPVTVNGSLTYGESDNESKRYVATDSIKADYDSSTLAADLRAGYTIALDDKFSVEPVAATRYTKVKIDGFTESGSAAALTTGSQSLEVFDIGGGLVFEADLGELKPTARIMAYRDLARDKAQTTSAFILGGNTFVTSGVEATPWTYEGGVGLEWSKDNYTVGASYDYTRKADFNASTTSLKARWDF